MAWRLKLMWAERGVCHVDSKMIKSSNIPLDVLHLAMKCGTQNLVGVKGKMVDVINDQRARCKGAGWVRKLGDAAEITHVGNCQERAASAFNYLSAVGRETGMAYFFMEGGGANHALVVLGLAGRPPDTTTFVFGTGEPAWGPDAVVCDPWYHEWFVVSEDWGRKGRRILQSTSTIVLAPETLITVKLMHYA